MKVSSINTAAPLPAENSILIIYTGGTLGMVYDLERQALAPFDFEQILLHLPQLKKFQCQLTVFSVEPLIDSANVKPQNWVDLGKIIYDNYNKYDGFVVLHGTDTMAYSASALSFILQNLSKPIIFTGAQLPIGEPRSDAATNLITAIEVAMAKQDGQAIVPEVCIYFDYFLWRGNRSKKVESTHFDAFTSPNYPHLAEVGVNIQYNHPAILKVNDQSLCYIHTLSSEVAILKLFPGIHQSTVEQTLFDPNIKAIIMETFGSGNAPTDEWFITLLQKAIREEDKIILNVSQCEGGAVMQGRYTTSKQLQQIGVISGSDITTEAALTKLMYVLGMNISLEEKKNKIKQPLFGELSTNLY